MSAALTELKDRELRLAHAAMATASRYHSDIDVRYAAAMERCLSHIRGVVLLNTIEHRTHGTITLPTLYREEVSE